MTTRREPYMHLAISEESLECEPCVLSDKELTKENLEGYIEEYGIGELETIYVYKLVKKLKITKTIVVEESF